MQLVGCISKNDDHEDHTCAYISAVHVKYFYRKFMDLEFVLYESSVTIYIYLNKIPNALKRY